MFAEGAVWQHALELRDDQLEQVDDCKRASLFKESCNLTFDAFANHILSFFATARLEGSKIGERKMVQVTLSGTDFSALQSQDINELYADLAFVSAGTAGPYGIDQGSLKSMRDGMGAKSFGDFVQKMILKGKVIFDATWPAIKSLVCKLYEQDVVKESELAGWVAKVAAAIIGVVNITAGVAIVVVTIALKLGLDALCKV